MAQPPKPIPPIVRKIILISAIIGYAALIAYLVFFVGLFSILSTLERVNLGIYVLALASVMLSIFFHTVVWYRLLQHLSIKVSFRKSFSLYWVGIFVNSIIPGEWFGDLFKAYLLSREEGVEGGKSVASIVTKKIFEAIFNLGNMVLGLVLLVLNYAFASAILFSIGLVMVLLALPLTILLVISFRPKEAKKIVDLFIRGFTSLSRNRWDLKKYQPAVNKIIEDYNLGMKILLEKPKTLAQPLVFSFFAWAFEVLTLFLVFAALGFIAMPNQVLIVRSIAGNLESQGYAFAGYAQIVATSLYTTLGVQHALAASVALLSGIVVFWLKTALSYVAFYFVVLVNAAKKIPIKVEQNENPVKKELDLSGFSKELISKEKTDDCG